MKKPWLAFICSFLLPGAGLAYLGRWLLAVTNLLVATAIVLGAILTVSSNERLYDYLHYLLLIVAAGSGGVAHGLTMQRNANVRRMQEGTRAGSGESPSG